MRLSKLVFGILVGLGAPLILTGSASAGFLGGNQVVVGDLVRTAVARRCRSSEAANSGRSRP